MLQLDINYSQLDDVIKKLEADNKQVEKALGRALRKTANWMKSQSAKEIAKTLDLPQKIVRERIFASTKNRSDGLSAKLWYGLNPIAYAKLKPVQKKDGVKAGKYFARGAFIYKEQVFKRQGKDRFPLEKQVLPIEKEAEIILSEAIFKGIEPYFAKRFEEELKWATR